MGGRGAASGVKKLSSATTEQKSMMERLTSKLTVGEYGKAGKYGGGQNVVVTKPVEYRMEKDGSISYTVKGEQITKPRESATIGVGNTPAKMRPVTVSGKIEKGGGLFLPVGAVQKGEERVVANTWNQYRKWFKERYGREP